jgi:excisionase family DNA binding protein
MRFLERLEQLESRLDQGDDGLWRAYAEAAAALAAVARETVPGAHGQLLTTAELAAQLRVSTRTLRRRRKAGQLEAVQLGERGRAALRWRAQ